MSWPLTEEERLLRDTAREFCLVICFEHELKHHERALVAGYRAGTWSAAWPHLSAAQREAFALRIGTVRWADIVARWPALRELRQLADVGSESNDA